MSEAAGLQAVAYYIDRAAGPAGEIPIGGLTRTDFRNKHLEYAITWFGLAATLIAVWLVFSLQKRPR